VATTTAKPLAPSELPRIAKAIRILCRIVESPPKGPWKMPRWYVEQKLNSSQPDDGVRTYESPHPGGIIHAASNAVLSSLMPNCPHKRQDCPEIADSQLEKNQKVKLIELRQCLINPLFTAELARNSTTAIQFCSFLDDVLVCIESDVAKAANVVLNQFEIAVLKELEKSSSMPLFPIDLESAGCASRKTLTGILRRLKSLDFACQPFGVRKGWVITRKGQKFLKSGTSH